MPVRVFLSHASADEPVVLDVKAFLEDGGDVQCWLDSFEIGFGDNIVSRINEGLAKSDAVVLFLSPVSMRSRWVEEELTAAYWDQVNSGQTRLIPVLIGDCRLPPLLANKKYCDLRTNRLEGMAQLKTALLRGHTAPAPGPVTGASLPNFVGREKELAELKERLGQPGAVVPIIGMAGIGKTWLARELIRRHGPLFEAVFELNCQGKSLAALVTDLAALAGLRLEGDAERAAADLRQYLGRKRCLLLLDNVEDDQPGLLAPGGRAAVMVTSRDGTIPFLAEYAEVKPQLFTEDEAFALFRRVLGEAPEEPARQLFRKLGYLPVALAVAAGLILKDVHYTVASLAAELPPLESLAFGKNNVGRLLSAAIASAEAPERVLLAAIAACAPSGVRLDFAAKVAGFAEPEALDALQGLFARSLVAELDRAMRRYSLHPLIRQAAAPSEETRRRQAEEALRALEDWERSPLEAAEFLEEADQAHQAGAGDPWSSVAIATQAGNLAYLLGRWILAYEFHQRAEQVAAKAGRRDWLEASYGNQALILKAWGRLEEAMALHQKEEAIGRELGDRAGLQASYGNQALILRDWGRLDEAMALRKKEEAIGRELGDRAGLGRCYGNQALILESWGRLDEAMALLQKKEAICQELGDRSGLQRTYGNQAVILKAWGRLDEAMALHQKEEAICRELGDRAGLQASYGNQALILRDWGRLDEAMALHQKEEAICRELGDRAGLQSSYGNQALILQSWGRLDEAMALLQKKEAICRELGDRAGLQASLGNQALILRGWGRLDEAMALREKEEAIGRELGDRAGLGRCYGNQALILQDRGRLDEAMALHQKEEAIGRELGDRAGLGRCYGNQALILKAWGRLGEAMALHQKKEAICRELGDRVGLGQCYGNQALILKLQGRLDEAMALHQKEEAICKELGDRAGLQRTYGNQALILQDWGRLDEAMALHQKEEAICQELGDRAGLQRTCGNQALILKAWGRLDEAMALLQKQEAICLELGNRAGLAYSYWNQGTLQRARNQIEDARKKLAAALAIFTELRTPREREAVQKALDSLPPHGQSTSSGA